MFIGAVIYLIRHEWELVNALLCYDLLNFLISMSNKITKLISELFCNLSHTSFVGAPLTCIIFTKG